MTTRLRKARDLLQQVNVELDTRAGLGLPALSADQRRVLKELVEVVSKLQARVNEQERSPSRLVAPLVWNGEMAVLIDQQWLGNSAPAHARGAKRPNQATKRRLCGGMAADDDDDGEEDEAVRRSLREDPTGKASLRSLRDRTVEPKPDPDCARELQGLLQICSWLREDALYPDVGCEKMPSVLIKIKIAASITAGVLNQNGIRAC